MGRMVFGAALTLSISGCGTTSAPASEAVPQPAKTAAAQSAPKQLDVLTGQAALGGDWSTDAPGVKRHITLSDLPAPYATPSVDNGPHLVPRPDGALPKVLPGFEVSEFAGGLTNPRNIITAPNGDIFVVESGANRVRILRDSKGVGKPDVNEIFVDGLRQPFGLAFYPLGPNPKYVYVANTDSVVRFPYRNGDLKASGPAEMVVSDISGGGRLRGGGHWTRDIVFSKDGSKMFVSVGSLENVMSNPADIDIEARRARIFEYNPDGSGETVYATGIRNPVGIAIDPATGQLWCSTNERDGLGDHLPPDYITHVTPGGFYGWPWFWMGGHPDKRAVGTPPPNAQADVITPDVLLQAHSASLKMLFYTARQFPKEFQGGAFAAEHGSWNRSHRTGYKVIYVPVRDGKATGVYEDFMTGFVTPDGQVWGRPVGLTVTKSGALLVSDDGSNTIWRVRYVGPGNAAKTARR
jgi:glucose/arabinose dehydrogenase